MTRPLSQVSGVGLLMAGLALILAFLTGCVTERSVDPKPAKHRLYFGGGALGTQDLIVVEVESDTLRQVIDTVPDFGWVSDMVVSPDGRWLYATRQEHTWPWELVKLNTLTLAIEGVLQEGASPYWNNPPSLRSLVLIDNGLTLVWSFGGDLWIIDTESFTVREIRERGISRIRGLEGTSLIAGVSSGKPVVYDVALDLVVAQGPPGNEGPEFRARQAVLHPDGEHLYCIADREDSVPYNHADIFLSVVNIPEWESVAEREIVADFANVAVGVKGYPVFVSECCYFHFYWIPSQDTLGGYLDVLTPTALTLLRSVSAEGCISYGGRGVYWLNRSPDGHVMYAAEMFGRWQVVALDAGSGEILSCFERPQYTEPGVMAVGPAPA